MKFDNNKLVILFSDKNKRKVLTPKQKIYFWENPKIYPRTCSICGERIIKIPDVEIDRNKEYTDNGSGLVLTHTKCNRMMIREELE